MYDGWVGDGTPLTKHRHTAAVRRHVMQLARSGDLKDRSVASFNVSRIAGRKSRKSQRGDGGVRAGEGTRLAAR